MLELLYSAPPGTWFPTAVAILVGLLVGSFLNVVIHRIPTMMQREIENFVATENNHEPVHTDRYSLVVPRSACPVCQHQISALENIPIISYLMIGGKCTSCKTPISPRYPIVEALTACLTGYMVWRFGSGVTGLAAAVFLWFLLALTFIDADTQLLPDDLTLTLLWGGLLVNLFGTFTSLHSAVIGAAVGYLTLWSIYWLFKHATGKEGMGYGDFKLLAALGAWLGWSMLPLIILLSSLVGAVVGVSLILTKKMNRSKPIPFGPYLAAAGLIAMLWGQSITAQYLRAVT
jgi:leader peptidase (prepilin peptidase) / N-methyltransferase